MEVTLEWACPLPPLTAASWCEARQLCDGGTGLGEASPGQCQEAFQLRSPFCGSQTGGEGALDRYSRYIF